MIPGRVTFPTADVRAVIPEGADVDILALGKGAMLTTQVFPQGVPGAIGHRVFAYEADVGVFDLTTLRHRGRPVCVGEWRPVQEGAPRIGATLRASFTGLPLVEVADLLPRYHDAA